MIKATIGIKLNQSQVYVDGKLIPVTNIKTGPVYLVSWKTKEKDGYDALQLGFGQKRNNILTKPIIGHLKKAGLEKNPPRFLKEIKIDSDDNVVTSEFQPGFALKVKEVFQIGDKVEVTGVSKGKGFQGVVKRHHFKGGPRTHGQSDRERAPGSIGQTTTPGRVYKGKRMAGRMGGKTVNIRNLQVIAIDDQEEILTLKGLVPGGKNSRLIIQKIK